MKCYKCNGTGVYDIYNDCPVCDGTGEYDPNDKGFGLPQNDNDIKVPPFTDGQKKLIEMTEKLANRKLICDVDDDIDVLTNEEWFCQKSTEEKAEFLVMIQMSVMHPVKRGAVDMDKFIEDVVDWLKQPHTLGE